MKKICIYSERWLNGGIENFLVNIIEGLGKDFLFMIITSQKETDLYDEILEKNNCKIVEMNDKHIKNPIIRTIKSIKKIRKTVNQYNFDVIHINMYNSIGLFYSYLLRKKNRKIICHAHNTGIDNDFLGFKRIIHKIIKRIFTKKDYRYISCSEEAASFCFFMKNVKDLKIINNGVDSYKFVFDKSSREKIRNQFNIDDEIKIIGHVGRFVKQKNHPFIINVFNEFLKMNPKSILILIGEGPEKDNIIKMVENIEIKDKVIFIDRTSKVNDFLNAFDLLLFPSLYEGLGIVLIEAQMSGLNCVVSDRIPINAKISDHFISVKLDTSYLDWAKVISSNIDYKREEGKLEESCKVFDKSYSIERMKNIYECK